MEICILQSGRGSRHWAGTSSWRLPHLTCLRQPSQDEIIALSVELAPLRSADETAALAIAMNNFPEGMPRRAQHVTAA